MRDACCHCRHCERSYRKTGSTTDSGLMLLGDGFSCTGERRRHTGLTTFQIASLLQICGDLCQWCSVGIEMSSAPQVHTAHRFTDYFSCKVEVIRVDTAATSAPIVRNTATSSWSSFHLATEEVRCIIMSSSVKSCSLDPMPTFLTCDTGLERSTTTRSECTFFFHLPPRTEDCSVPVVMPWCDVKMYCVCPSLSADLSPCTGCYKLILLTLYAQQQCDNST